MTALASTDTEGKRGRGRPKGSKDGDISDFNEARARHEHWKATLAELEAKRKAGELVEVSAVEQESAMDAAALAQTLRSIPDTLERVAGITPEQAEIVEKIIDAALLANYERKKARGGW